MRRLDEVYLAHPEFGAWQMARWFRRQGYDVNRKRMQRVMRLIGVEAIYQKPNLSRCHPEYQVYPYRLRNLTVVVTARAPPARHLRCPHRDKFALVKMGNLARSTGSGQARGPPTCSRRQSS